MPKEPSTGRDTYGRHLMNTTERCVLGESTVATCAVCDTHCADWPEDGGASDDTRDRPSNDHRRRVASALQLMQSPEHEFDVLRGGVAHHRLSTSSSPLYRAVWARSALVDRLPEGLDRVRRRRQLALIVDSPTAEYVVTRRPCDLYATEPFLDVAAHLRTAVDRRLVRLRRDGVLQELYLRWWRTECEHWPAARPGRADTDSVPLDRGRQRGRQSDSPRHQAARGVGALTQHAASLNTVVAVVTAYLVAAVR